MSDTPFSPFDDILDRDTALSVLREAVAEALMVDDGRLKTASYDAATGFGLRAVRGEVAGYAHSTEISEAALRRAAQTARLAVGDGGGTWADAPVGTNQQLYTDQDPIAGAAFSVKVEAVSPSSKSED